MCYSAEVWNDYRRYVKSYGADISIKEFYRIFVRRSLGGPISVAKALEDAFLSDREDEVGEIVELINSHRAAEAQRLQTLMFNQKARLAEADRKLELKVTKTWSEAKRISTDKIQWALRKIETLNRREPRDSDRRIFPGDYLPVMIMENGRRVVKPMRFHCRPAGKPESNDVRYPGCYNARRDSLEGYWSSVFGVTHGVVVANAFYEHVNRHRLEQRELAEGEKVEDVILEFRPRPAQDMHLACLWSHWTAPGKEDLYSVAFITDHPPPEVAIAGHDRCVIPIDPANLDDWLQPDKSDLKAQYAILDERDRPYYEHRLAA